MTVLRRVLPLLTLLMVGATGSLVGQGEKPLDHESYDLWKRIQGQTISDDGRYLAYTLTPGEGDESLIIRDLRNGQELTVPRATGATFSKDSRFLILTINPMDEVEEAAREDGRKRDDMPADSLGVVNLAASFGAGGVEAFKVEGLRSFRLPEEGDGAIAYHLEEESADGDDETEEEEPQRGSQAGGEEDEAEGPDRDKDAGTPLILRNLASGEEHRFEHALDYEFSEDGGALFYTASSEDSSADGVYRVDVGSGTAAQVLTGPGEYTRLTVDTAGEQVAFLSNREDWITDAEQPESALYLGDQRVAAFGSAGIPSGWWVSENGNLSFSEDGVRLFFGSAPRPEPEVEDDTPEDERVRVDVWNWQDPYLQPMQLVRADQEARRTFRAYYSTESGRIVQLADETVPTVNVGQDGTARYAVGRSELPYRQLVSWDGTYNDIYVVDVETGDREMALEMVRGNATISPDGRYLAWWDGTARAWFTKSRESGEVVNVTEPIPHPVHNILDDHPAPRPSYGSAGWTENDESFVVYDEFDIWALDPSGRSNPRNLTEGRGRESQIRFRYQRVGGGFGGGGAVVPTDEEVLLTAFDPNTKESGFYRDHFGQNDRPEQLIMDGYRFSTPTKAEDADVYVFTRQSFTDFPDLWVSDTDFGGMEKISNANPQQAEYSWGQAEIVGWRSTDGTPLQGILYKPDGFDPSREYPMMVYFYERSSDGLHQYFTPSAGTSINRSFYVSRDYLLFVPDIPYREGYPGESAVAAVVPGILSLLDQGFVDEERIGVQGHSWGGYQIAYMITETDIFAAAEAGAPVVNMTSAYGGIRWQSGMSRMFQYEKTQSRIGGTLWDATQRYVENSPLFFADKITTPLLMLHNDEDGAVPWYQGIEMFVAMRRLEKPVWMLNYNGEAHGLRREANQKDWAIRMQQFFDHYLVDAPPPRWMVEGVPATVKGKEFGLELITTRPISEEPQTQSSGSANRNR